jgi:hypothetical protein
MEELGRLVRLQVQVAPLKRGERPDRWYDPARIVEVDELTITPHGVVGHLDGRRDALLDVHHRDHPESRARGDNAVSIGFLGHYAALRRRFGDHVTDGIAGENLVVDDPGRVERHHLAGGVRIDGEPVVGFGAAAVIEPCVEFSRLVLDEPDTSVTEVLQELRGGMRGYYLEVPTADVVRVRRGARVLASPDEPVTSPDRDVTSARDAAR